MQTWWKPWHTSWNRGTWAPLHQLMSWSRPPNMGWTTTTSNLRGSATSRCTVPPWAYPCCRQWPTCSWDGWRGRYWRTVRWLWCRISGRDSLMTFLFCGWGCKKTYRHSHSTWTQYTPSSLPQPHCRQKYLFWTLWWKSGTACCKQTCTSNPQTLTTISTIYQHIHITVKTASPSASSCESEGSAPWTKTLGSAVRRWRSTCGKGLTLLTSSLAHCNESNKYPSPSRGGMPFLGQHFNPFNRARGRGQGYSQRGHNNPHKPNQINQKQ